MRATIGRQLAATLLADSLDRGRIDAALGEAMRDADVVWWGARGPDFDAGPRVLIVERLGGRAPTPDPTRWAPAPTEVPGAARFVARAPVLPIEATEIIDLPRARAFVSGLATKGVRQGRGRIARARRAAPDARGVVSLELLGARPSDAFVRRYPALASLVRGVERVSAVVEVEPQRVILDLRIRCDSTGSAGRLLRFLTAFRSTSLENPRLADLFEPVEAQAEEQVVTVRWRIPPSRLLPTARAFDEDPAIETNKSEYAAPLK